MESAESIQRSLPRDAWVTSIDLVDTYLHIPVHRGYRNVFDFRVGTPYTNSGHCRLAFLQHLGYSPGLWQRSKCWYTWWASISVSTWTTGSSIHHLTTSASETLYKCSISATRWTSSRNRNWSQNRNSFFCDTSSTWFPSKSLQLWINITKSSTDLLIPAKPRRMCSYTAHPARSLCVHRKNGYSGTAAHPWSPTLHLSTLGFQCFNQQLVDTSFPQGRGRFPMVEVSTQCSEGSPSYPDRTTRHSGVHGCIEFRLGSTLVCIDAVWCMDNNREHFTSTYSS